MPPASFCAQAGRERATHRMARQTENREVTSLGTVILLEAGSPAVVASRGRARPVVPLQINVVNSYERLLLLSFCHLCQGKSQKRIRQNVNAEHSNLDCRYSISMLVNRHSCGQRVGWRWGYFRMKNGKLSKAGIFHHPDWV